MDELTEQAIGDYLDELLVHLHGRARGVRRILDEVEDHLRSAVEEGRSAQEAIEHFGPPARVARHFRTTPGPVTPALRELFLGLLRIAAVGLVAIGISGLLAIGMRAVWGADFVAGDPDGLDYTAERCATFESFHPEAPTCEAAASAHHADEVEQYRMAAGGLGAVLGAALWIHRRRVGPVAAVALLPDGLLAAVGAALFGVAAAGLSVLTLSGLAFDGHGAGQFLGAAVVSAAVAAGYAWSVLQCLRERSAVLT